MSFLILCYDITMHHDTDHNVTDLYLKSCVAAQQSVLCCHSSHGDNVLRECYCHNQRAVKLTQCGPASVLQSFELQSIDFVEEDGRRVLYRGVGSPN
jgi:hypothetical protein